MTGERAKTETHEVTDRATEAVAIDLLKAGGIYKLLEQEGLIHRPAATGMPVKVVEKSGD